LYIEAYDIDSSTPYDTEIITFTPKNVPVLDLDNDTATIAYKSNGIAKLNFEDEVFSTATVYFNGEAINLATTSFK
jgi:hypothetical protein